MDRTATVPARAGAILLSSILLAACASKPASTDHAPAPVAPPVERSYTEKLDSDGLFRFGRATLGDMSADGRAALDGLVAKLAQGRAIESIQVIGHSDRIGKDSVNLSLSTRRAESVRDYLVEQGIPAERISAVGRGSVEPIVTCENERGQALIACLAPNRRVEVQVNYAN